MISALKGKRILNTRAVHQAAAFNTLSEEAGAISLEYPCIAILLPEDTTMLDRALNNLHAGRYDWLVLTSTNTIATLAVRLKVLGLTLSNPTFRTAAIGPATAATAQAALGLQPLDLPDEYMAETLAAHVPLGSGDRILLPKSAIARPTLADQLSARGAQVTIVTAYQTVTGSGGVDVTSLLANQQIDALTFTSSSTVTGFMERLNTEGANVNLALQLPVICIGPKTAATAHEAGFTQVHASDDHTLAGLIRTLDANFTHETKMRETP